MEPMTLEMLAELAGPRLQDATSGDLSDAAFPMIGDVARAYLLGKAELLQWVVEMCG